MNYNDLRHFADSWGLVMMALAFLVLTGWTFLPSAKRGGERAATSIFEDEEPIDG